MESDEVDENDSDAEEM
jgi:hypothetical protein